MRTNIHLLEFLTKTNTVRQYAVWLRLKASFNNSCVYNYNISSLSKKAGLSRTSIRKHINFFIENKWAHMYGDHLQFISGEKLLQLYHIKLRKLTKLNRTTQIQTTVNNIRFELLKDKERKFEYLKKVSQDLLNPKGKGALEKFKKATRFFKKYPNIKPIGENATNFNFKDLKLRISCNSMGEIIKKSASTISNLIRLKEREGKIEVIRKCNVFHQKLSQKQYEERSYYLWKTYWIKVECNQYVFL